MADLGGAAPTNGTNVTEPCDLANTSARFFFVVIYSLVFLVGLVLNGFTLRFYFCGSQQQSAGCVTIYLKNLAAADFLLSLCLPVKVAYYASDSIHIRLVYCNFGASAFYLNMYASILFMGYIAANRYLKIVHPLGTHVLQTVRAAHIVSMVTWGCLLAMTSIYVLVSLLTQQAPDSITNISRCDILHSPQLSLLYRIIHACSAAIFLLVLVSLVFFYRSISRRLSQAQERQPASSGSKKLAKSRRNMLVLVSVFCVCFVPYHLVRLPYAFRTSWWCSWNQVFYHLKELSIMVSVLNVCLDPLIYFIFCKAFRSQLSFRRVFSITPAAMNAAGTERRSSDGRTSGARVHSTTSKQMDVLLLNSSSKYGQHLTPAGQNPTDRTFQRLQASKE
ncbi:P2Y purinoceptor 14-like [Stegastes partitus]|uniref:P2Y purinoceptor 14-like n=1 Tax=Stegastes partitus TaxID=144197 RepID=A0A3B4YZL8_9TELE|nr:PREDICTED: P2Y purinoceptor 14-like [Stegastes partitus]XP_008301439.1 PREDICTED: P2Y purinoceptor 14-like [Stegastes partitus]